MTDLQTAKNNLAGHTICLCREGNCLYSNENGISPMMNFIADGIDLNGYAVADLIVGKAVAMLFVKSGINKVFAKTLSKNGRRILDLYDIEYEYEILTEQIINRAGTDICPMEKAVMNIDDVNLAYLALEKQLKLLKK